VEKLMAWKTIDTPVGPFTIAGRDDTVIAAAFTDDVGALVAPVPLNGDADIDRFTKAVAAYFDGDLTAIDAVPVEQPGGAFMQQGWKALRAIPAGEPLSYTAFAAALGRSPTAARAAAQACARNTIALFVPCHRVVRTDGSLGGYRWGVDIKRFLLAHEAETES
jgi:methylated-DNA-[protein]-cysteine S-methyltransferase